MNYPRIDFQGSKSFCWLVPVLGFGMLAQTAFAQLIRVPEDQAKKAIISKVEPAYPPLARQMRLSGHVLLDMYVDETGSVEKADVVSGNPILGNAAVTAAKRWRFQPFQADGKATKAVVRVGFDFAD
jgi:protein TonB